MCMLSFIPAGKSLCDTTVTSLYNGGVANRDGYGWAIASSRGLILMGRSLDLDTALEQFIVARSKDDGDAMFHSRYATHGSVRLGNCHPFLVGNSHKTVLGHNGVLPKSVQPRNGDDRSDTAIMAAELLPSQYRRLDRPRTRKALSDYCGRGNKLLILTVDTRYRETAYLINESAGTWDRGAWHSNYDYLGYSGRTYRATTADEYVEIFDDPTACYECGQRVNDYGLCTTCLTCQDCLEQFDECLCFTPELYRSQVSLW